MILSEFVEVKPSGKTIKYYRDLGYDAQHLTPLLVSVKDLSNNSHERINVKCDICGRDTDSIYQNYYRITNGLTTPYYCSDCAPKKVRENCIAEYGVSNHSKRTEVIQKIQDTFQDKYNTTNAMGVPEFRKKIIENNYKKYGVGNVMDVPELREKAKIRQKEYLEEHGEELYRRIVEKGRKTMYKNETGISSRQQRYLCNLYQGELNFPLKMYSLDIYLPENEIDVEFDGSGHELSQILGKITKEEFERKEIIRNITVKNAGIKCMRIVSRKDRLPSDYTLLQMLSDSRHYFQTTSHTWQTYDIDKSLLFDAEHKDGIPYDFGILRTIKESDLQSDLDLTTTKKGA